MKVVTCPQFVLQTALKYGFLVFKTMGQHMPAKGLFNRLGLRSSSRPLQSAHHSKLKLYLLTLLF